MATMKIVGDPMADLLEEMDRIGMDVKPAATEALEKTQNLISNNLKSAAQIYDQKGGGQKGYATGKMYRTIISDQHVSWEGSIATVNAGFALKENGGFHSIFVMYGTPRMMKDTKVYNAIKGARTRTRIAKIQEEVMKKYLKLGR